MEASRDGPTTSCHVVALPYPGRGHINPMMNLCKVLSLKNPHILITFVVTEEWLGFISSEAKPANVRYKTVPNVIPSELGRANDFPGFIEAVFTKLEQPFERFLDQLELPVSAIVTDTYMAWAVGVGNRRNIPVASLWPMSATVFSVFHHFELLVKKGHFPVDLSEQGEELVNYIPGIPPTRLVDLPTIFRGRGQQVLNRALESVSSISNAQYLLFASIYELESEVIDALKSKLPIPVYSLGPLIPYLQNKDHEDNSSIDYLEWLNSQRLGSVLYISLGSFLSVSTAQMDEIVAGVRDSGVPFLWVSRSDSINMSDNEKGMMVPWCDQLRVLSHPSVGGFWTHCGWNSTMESLYAGVSMLTFPIFWDQTTDSKLIVEDWKVGRRVKGSEVLVKRDEIAELVKGFMDSRSIEGRERRERTRALKEICKAAVEEGGSTHTNLDSFIKDILLGQSC
ncbi:UDP-glycosyltransferase 87A1-like [Tripterygium wilfordii]|uniref:UDP-glycosyltransferase 87A1-like n=1 Tax=Tripterygium wilfordii TaxID=458696 RepID=A0A7J7DEI1_TRIWF|nr:UDP-glycosyltransferase 87A1-like [Tripterygium wilfordii]KAF5744476.1 UDP-glycosyltransferase 87A1-like [Tripterygium wilfordii]